MGLGPPILALYRQLKLMGTFEGIDSVVELGSQGVWCPDRRLLFGLFEAFGRPIPSRDELDVYINSSGTGLAASRDLHEKLGFKYDCVDIDGNFGSLTLDINFDAVPPEARGKYGLTTNHGTTEHVLDQRNAFKMIHDFTAPGGLILHALPFTVHLEHGFFNYQPNLFDALARYNSYETLGTWVGPDWSLSSLVPWEPRLLEFLTLSAKTTHLLVVLQKKLHDTEFCIPIQGVYEPMLPESAIDRYQLVVDGQYYRRAQQVSKEIGYAKLDEMPAIYIARYLSGRIVRRLKRSIGQKWNRG
jgi:SAM-dependent methyltransferase